MQGNRLYVGNLPYSATSQGLQDLFSEHGTVKQVNVIEGKGFGFVEMSSAKEAEAAKAALDGTEYEGRTIRVDEARPPKERPTRRFSKY
jgi:RNA recognition motif-containing protein